MMILKKLSQKMKIRQKKLENRKVVVNTASKSYDKLLNIYTTK